MAWKRQPATRRIAVFAAALVAAPAMADSGSNPNAAGDTSLQEVVVTAQKREERLIDVPAPVTAISGSALLDENKTQLEDYFRDVPGLVLIENGSGQATLAVRGISTGNTTNPTVGVTIDDVPYGSVSGLAFGSLISPPDLDPSDLQRVEVLRGPQGTLYGASSLGGLLKFVTADPSFDGVSGRVGIDGNSIDDGGFGGSVRGAVNVPLLSDTLAMRASGFYRTDGGFIDDPLHGDKDLNAGHAEGGHLAFLWKLDDQATLKLSAIYQQNITDGQDLVDTNYQGTPTYGDLEQVRVPGSGGSEMTVQLYSANLNVNLPANLKLSSVTGYAINTWDAVLDFSSEFGPALGPIYGLSPGDAGVPAPFYWHTRRLSQEIRLSQHTDLVDWIVGGFYTRERSNDFVGLNVVNFDTGQLLASYTSVYDEQDFFHYNEYAGFSTATFHITPKLDFGAGLRYAHNDQLYQTFLGGLVGGNYLFRQSSSDQSTTYSVGPSYKLSTDLLLYIRVASGYRPGGPNAGLFGAGTPRTYDADRTTNYEVGFKGETLDKHLTFDASVFYIDWRDIQIGSVDPTTGYLYYQNGRTASSKGVELSVTGRPWTGASVTASTTVGRAELTADLPATAALALSGDRLPNSPEATFSLDVEQTFALTADITGFAGGSVNYVGSRVGMFATSNPPGQVRPPMPAYGLGGLRMGIRTMTQWTVSAYVSNLGNERAVLGVGTRAATSLPTDPFGETVARPRTFGIAVSKSF